MTTLRLCFFFHVLYRTDKLKLTCVKSFLLCTTCTWQTKSSDLLLTFLENLLTKSNTERWQMTIMGDLNKRCVKSHRETGVLDRNSELNMTASAHVRHVKETLNENRSRWLKSSRSFKEIVRRVWWSWRSYDFYNSVMCESVHKNTLTGTDIKGYTIFVCSSSSSSRSGFRFHINVVTASPAAWALSRNAPGTSNKSPPPWKRQIAWPSST